jgi:hypothetical protein
MALRDGSKCGRVRRRTWPRRWPPPAGTSAPARCRLLCANGPLPWAPLAPGADAARGTLSFTHRVPALPVPRIRGHLLCTIAVFPGPLMVWRADGIVGASTCAQKGYGNRFWLALPARLPAWLPSPPFHAPARKPTTPQQPLATNLTSAAAPLPSTRSSMCGHRGRA